MSIFVYVLGQFLTTCGTIHFLVDDCLGPLFTNLGPKVIGLFLFFRQFVFRTGYLSRASQSPDQVSALFQVGAHCFQSSLHTCSSIHIYTYIYNKILSQSTPILHTLVSVSIVVSVDVRVFSEKRLRLVTVNRRECPSQSFC